MNNSLIKIEISDESKPHNHVRKDKFYIGGIEMEKNDNTKGIEIEETVVGQSVKKGNIIAGIVGAFLGSLIGVAAIVFIGQLGYIASIAGIVLAVCTLKGYELLGGALTKISVSICVLIMIVMICVGEQLDWAISITKQLNNLGDNIDIFTSFRSIPMWLKEGSLDVGDYLKNLGLLFLFVILGAGSNIYEAFKKNEEE